ncbi:muscle LIM protein Mlp84B-like isoform X4 [Hetaerina americana]|uniref:muscle LIM protein Mlp84B-like isoform X4 n=1 Tax=Hetaerina americana TaxID=62018 RepID=UPI003A7F37B6
MPFKPVEHPKCPKCQKSVYAAEERVAGGLKWHKGCFKCGLCNKMLDSTNCTEHEGELFCKMCHARKYGPKGYGFGGGAGCLSMDKGEHLGNTEASSRANSAMEPRAIAKAPEGEGCPRCGGFVYAAEQMLARGRAWHKGCFKCRTCTRTLDSTLACDAPDGEVYCRANRTRPGRPSSTRPSSRLPRVRGARAAAVSSTRQSRCSPRAACGIASASSAKTATKHWIPSWHATDQIRTSIAKPATGRSMDLMDTASLAVPDFCRQMA